MKNVVIVRHLCVHFAVGCFALNLFLVDEVRADISWLDKITNCEELALRVHEYALAIQADKPISDAQRVEIDSIFAVACGERFRKCRYMICNDIGMQRAGASEPLGKEGQPNDLSTDANLNRGVPAIDGGAFTRDPLAWLKHDWSCEELNEQIKLRYSPLGEYRDWPENKKQEMSQIMMEACGQRFAHCKYPACPIAGESGKVDKSDSKSDGKSDGKADAKSDAKSDIAETGDAKKEKKVKK